MGWKCGQQILELILRTGTRYCQHSRQTLVVKGLRILREILLGEAGSDEYYISVEATYVGTSDDDEDDYNSFINHMSTVHTDKIVYFDMKSFDTFYDKLLAQAPESVWTTNSVEMMPSVLLNSSATVDPSLTEDLIDMWIPGCYRLL